MGIVRIERIKEKEDPNKAPLWMVSITDLTTILLAFFILLFATAQPDKQNWSVASHSLRSSFGGKDKPIDAQNEAGSKDAEQTLTSRENDPGLNLDYLHSLIKKYIQAEPGLQDIAVWKKGDMVILSLPSDLSFATGKTDLSPEGRAILIKLVPMLDKLPNQLEIIGHADQTAIMNDSLYNSNWQLSLARANSVAEALSYYGYAASIAIRGRGAGDADLLPKNIPVNIRNSQARRVDLRLHMVHP